ncbi:putative deoxyribonuclease TATDN2 isoform X2 [Hyla sarda]|uniref:putative deoxyribonuclease TATDN2 isoform X2 n=1 Tax=Hyla sarda TaxID=327740 RepID=UPI0024C417C4|nr:putative deoxyribonuclease TATDN2 isoform X2 [Hyla sarda]
MQIKKATARRPERCGRIMADRSASGSRKHKWLSPPEMSPSKYLRSGESRRVSHSRDRDAESPSPSQDRRVTYRPHESTPRRRLDIGAGVRSTVRARIRQTDGLQTHRDDSQTETSEKRLDKEHDHQEEENTEGNSRSGYEVHKMRNSKVSGPSLLFKKAFSDILGTPCRPRRSLDSETRRSLEGKKVEKRSHSDPQESPLTPLTAKSTSSEKKVVGERKQRSEDVKKAPSTRRVVTNVTPTQKANVLPETPRLVFLDENSDEDVDKTTDLGEKDPSIGSDFSDIEDVEPLARFPQDSEVSPCCSMQDDIKTSNYQYESPWRRYTEQPLSSPIYRPAAEHNTWRQKEQDSTYLSEHSLLNSSYLSVSSNESPVEKSRKRTNSWTFEHTIKSVRRSLEIPLPSSTDSKFLDGGFIDTHCHLDMLFARLSHRSSFADLRKQYTSTFPQEFHGCITDYCDPRTLQNLPWQQVLNEDLVWGAFGCHPHFAQYYDDHLHEDMMMALRHPKAIAFGEMGLDYSHKCSTSIPDQMTVFEKQLKLVVPLGKPLVIHCRGADKDLFKIMKKWVPQDYKIHRHCFTGKYEDIEPFLNEFPNMAVGFTAVLTYPSAWEARDAVAKIPLERLIVETDAPFFVPKQVPKRVCKFAHPGLALHTVHEIARLRNLPVKTIMSKLRENTYRIYSI